MKQNRGPRDKPLYIWQKDLQQGSHDHSMGKGQSLHQMVLRELDIHMEMNETGPLPYTVYKD